jgi:c-di-GMP-binding flagellar brake protein YcgR
MSDATAVLLLDDGELTQLAGILDRSDIRYLRLRGGEIQDNLTPPSLLLITTPRHASKVRAGSAASAQPGRPMRIIAVEEDSPSMRRMLRNMGFNLLVRQPIQPEVWRLLVQRALYQGAERRTEARLPIGSKVTLESDGAGDPAAASQAWLVDISNRGCHLVTPGIVPIGSHLSFPLEPGDASGDRLHLSGVVVRSLPWTDSHSEKAQQSSALLFDEHLDERTRSAVARMINALVTDTCSLAPPQSEQIALPATECADLPGLCLDDETDPPVSTDLEVSYRIEPDSEVDSEVDSPGSERRTSYRANFQENVAVVGGSGSRVLMGRDVSSGGMKVERLPGLEIGDRLRLALYGPSEPEAIEIDAEVIRDDGKAGLGLRFTHPSPETSRALEKFVACLPSVESLEDGELDGMGTIISEILPN